MKRYTASPVARKMQTDITLNFHQTPARMLKSKVLTIPIANEDGKQQGLIHSWWKCKDIQIERQLAFFLNKTKHSLSYDQATTILGSYKPSLNSLSYTAASQWLSTLHVSVYFPMLLSPFVPPSPSYSPLPHVHKSVVSYVCIFTGTLQIKIPYVCVNI